LELKGKELRGLEELVQRIEAAENTCGNSRLLVIQDGGRYDQVRISSVSLFIVDLRLVRLGHMGRVKLGDGDGLHLHCDEGLLGEMQREIGLRDGVDGTSELPLLYD
jgi:hypothetical protein